MVEGMVRMSHKEIDRLGVIQQVASRRLRQKAAAARLGLSIRQLRRLLHRYRSWGLSDWCPDTGASAPGMPSRRNSGRSLWIWSQQQKLDCYNLLFLLVGRAGVEPATNGLKGRSGGFLL